MSEKQERVVEVRLLPGHGALTTLGVRLRFPVTTDELEVKALRTEDGGRVLHTIDAAFPVARFLIEPFWRDEKSQGAWPETVKTALQEALEHVLGTRVCCKALSAEIDALSGRAKQRPE